VENCDQPAVFRKELCLKLHKERQTDGMLSRLMRGSVPDVNMDSAIYALTLKPAAASSKKGEKEARKYVRGEENLGDWRPRSPSLIEEHQEQLRTHEKLAEFESLKQDYVLIRELNRASGQPSKPKPDAARAKELVKMAVDCWKHGPLEKRLSSPPETPISSPHAEANVEENTKFNPEVKRVELSGMCAKKGPLELQDFDTDTGRNDVWAKRYVQVKRPYVILTYGERDPVMRDVIHLSQIKIQYSQEQALMMGNPNVFTLLSRDHAMNLRARNKMEVVKWIEALDPLQAGSILSRESMKSATSAEGGRRRSGSVIF